MEVLTAGRDRAAIDDLLARADFVSLHCPLTEDTRGLIGEDALARMKDSAILVNTARGPIVDTDALVAALHAGTIAGAGLDVTDPEPLPADHPLLRAPGAIVLPHIGSATAAARARMADRAVDNLLAALDGEPMPYPVSEGRRRRHRDELHAPARLRRRGRRRHRRRPPHPGHAPGPGARRARLAASRRQGARLRHAVATTAPSSTSCGPSARSRVLTSAVRDAADGAEFTREVAERFGLEARTISGEEEGRLTFLGATAERPAGGPEPVAVIDVGGGSTEFVVGAGGRVSFFVSVQAGVVRQTERFLAHDPPEHGETQALAEDVRALFAAALPEEIRHEVAAVIGVAGTATSVAAIDLGLEPYDPDRVEGFRAPLGTVEELLARLATMDEDERREVAGLHPDRAATIIAGMVILLEALRALGVDEFEVSEHDILRGAALAAAGRASGMDSG